MNVYLRAEDGLELVGQASLPEGWSGDYVVDVGIAGAGAALRLVYAVESVPCLTPALKLEMERAVVLSLGQTPDFLPGWERAEA